MLFGYSAGELGQILIMSVLITTALFVFILAASAS
jgi:hypothetical protein